MCRRSAGALFESLFPLLIGRGDTVRPDALLKALQDTAVDAAGNLFIASQSVV
jgi:hypothetical protein